MNIAQISAKEKLIEKVVHETCKFFMYSVRHMTSKNGIVFSGIRLGLKPFQALKIFAMLQIEVDTSSRDMFVDKMRYNKIKCLIF